MIAWQWEDFGIKSPVATVRVVNDILGTEHTFVSTMTRGEILEGLLRGCYRSSPERDALEFSEPIAVCFYFMEDEIVMRYHANGDEAKAREAMEAIVAKGWAAV